MDTNKQMREMIDGLQRTLTVMAVMPSLMQNVTRQIEQTTRTLARMHDIDIDHPLPEHTDKKSFIFGTDGRKKR